MKLLQQIVKLSVQNEPEKFHEMGEPHVHHLIYIHYRVARLIEH
jgi:hypothetical protein